MGENNEEKALEKIENESERLISFTKRRNSIYKKASDTSTLCDAEIGILVFSPGGKAFTFGSPNMETIANRFFGRNNNPSTPEKLAANIMEAHWKATLEEANRTHDRLDSQRSSLMKEGEELSKIKMGFEEECWWEAPVEDLTPQQLQQLAASMDILKTLAFKKEQELLANHSST